MITISISTETRTLDGMALALREIADRLEEGCTSGFGPEFTTEGDEELEEEDYR